MRFNGTYEDWPRFWNQFVEIIDKAAMPGATKFAYLKSFLDPKVKKISRGISAHYKRRLGEVHTARQAWQGLGCHQGLHPANI